MNQLKALDKILSIYYRDRQTDCIYQLGGPTGRVFD